MGSRDASSLIREIEAIQASDFPSGYLLVRAPDLHAGCIKAARSRRTHYKL